MRISSSAVLWCGTSGEQLRLADSPEIRRKNGLPYAPLRHAKTKSQVYMKELALQLPEALPPQLLHASCMNNAYCTDLPSCRSATAGPSGQEETLVRAGTSAAAPK